MYGLPSAYILSPLDMKGCICHFVKWQIHPFISKGTIYKNRLFWLSFVAMVWHQRHLSSAYKGAAINWQTLIHIRWDKCVFECVYLFCLRFWFWWGRGDECGTLVEIVINYLCREWRPPNQRGCYTCHPINGRPARRPCGCSACYRRLPNTMVTFLDCISITRGAQVPLVLHTNI